MLRILKSEIDDPLQFGYMNGLKTGGRYLVFLNKNIATIFTTTNFQKQFFDKERLSSCRSLRQSE